MQLKSVLRLGRLCRIAYGFFLVYVIIQIISDILVDVNGKITHAPELNGRGLLASIKAHMPKRGKYQKSEKHHGHPVRPNLYRSGAKFEKTFKLMRNHPKNNISWHGGRRYCENNLENINEDIIYLRNVILDTKKMTNKDKGGEVIKKVINQKEKEEKVIIQPGFFKLPCSQLPPIKIIPLQGLFRQWFDGIIASKHDVHLEVARNLTNLTIFRFRGDYANLYWTLIELYDTYLTVRLLRKESKSVNVILVDAHPEGKLDGLWDVLFGKVIRIGTMKGMVSVQDLAWSIHGSSSPITQAWSNLPFIQDFKNLFYASVGLKTDKTDLCSNMANGITITLVLRRNYIAHPRNPSGKIMRKISNEKELINHLENKFSNYTFKAVQLDNLPLEKQLLMISQTTVLIGVHGAGLAYALLLRPGATCIELFPSKYKRSPNRHFEQFALWSGVKYLSWYATGSTGNTEWINVPLDVAENMIKSSLVNLCKPKPRKTIVKRNGR